MSSNPVSFWFAYWLLGLFLNHHLASLWDFRGQLTKKCFAPSMTGLEPAFPDPKSGALSIRPHAPCSGRVGIFGYKRLRWYRWGISELCLKHLCYLPCFLWSNLNRGVLGHFTSLWVLTSLFLRADKDYSVFHVFGYYVGYPSFVSAQYCLTSVIWR